LVGKGGNYTRGRRGTSCSRAGKREDIDTSGEIEGKEGPGVVRVADIGGRETRVGWDEFCEKRREGRGDAPNYYVEDQQQRMMINEEGRKLNHWKKKQGGLLFKENHRSNTTYLSKEG